LHLLQQVRVSLSPGAPRLNAVFQVTSDISLVEFDPGGSVPEVDCS